MTYRTAVVYSDSEERVARYLLGNYRTLGTGVLDSLSVVFIGGTDRCGWTLDEYVLPRLASGLIRGKEMHNTQLPLPFNG